MTQSLWIAKTGLDAQQTKMAVISNNLANTNTTGFKRDRASFEDLLYQTIRQPGGATALDPSKIMVRIVQDGLTEAKDTGRTARVMGHTVRVMAVPFAQMGDRREYPTPPGYTPLATVR